MKHLERALDGQNQWWKYLVIFIAGLIGANFIGAIPLVIVIVVKSIQSGGAISSNPSNFADLTAYGISPNLGLILMIIPFIIALITIVLLFKPLHKRHYCEIINGTRNVRWKRFFFSIVIWGLIMLIYLLIDHSINPSNYKLNINLSAFIPLIFISILLIPFQTTYEEVIFRGYFTQGVAAWTKSRLWAIIIPSLLFGLMHSFNPEIKVFGFWAIMPSYIIFGLFFAIVTILDDGIEVAMGAHAANNIFSSIFVTSKSSVLQTPALFEQQVIEPNKETLILILSSTIFIAILKYKYHWKLSTFMNKVE
ncbi:MAG: CPBP family intramembrane metalloprotease [Bacteroidales bacterium]|nr:MAG: CPBP family intramembrane metalloprotease [Bacteroidales bacterium]